MKCAFCGGDPEPLVLLNFREGDIFSCIPCARERGHYCDLHDAAHSEYPPDGTTCILCVSEMAEHNFKRGGNFLNQIYRSLPREVLEELNDYLDYNPEKPDRTWRVKRIVHELSLRACCRRMPLRSITEEICRTQSIRPIFP